MRELELFLYWYGYFIDVESCNHLYKKYLYHIRSLHIVESHKIEKLKDEINIKFSKYLSIHCRISTSINCTARESHRRKSPEKPCPHQVSSSLGRITLLKDTCILLGSKGFKMRNRTCQQKCRRQPYLKLPANLQRRKSRALGERRTK